MNNLHKIFCLVGFLVGTGTAEFSCDTELDWIPKEAYIKPLQWTDYIVETANVLEPRKSTVSIWPNGIVKYHVNSTLSASEQFELNSAFEEYHQKTCVQFEPWTGNLTESYVSIERYEDVKCAKAHVCRRGTGYQYARFHTDCMDKSTFVHEFGHSLCLAHEHQRNDRDDHLNFTGCDPSKLPSKPLHYTDKGLYDYASQMHYPCKRCPYGKPNHPVPPVCGEMAHSGLSVMDADAINLIYKCGGCKRHRWIPIFYLHADERFREEMLSFGNVNNFGTEIFPCRAHYQGEVSVGMYKHETGKCVISSFRANKTVIVTDEVEVLTIPSEAKYYGCAISLTRSEFSQYELESQFGSSENEIILKRAVPAASIIFDYDKYYEGYIAFGTIPVGFNDQIFVLNVIGTVWNINGRLQVQFPNYEGKVDVNNVKILVCNEYVF